MRCRAWCMLRSHIAKGYVTGEKRERREEEEKEDKDTEKEEGEDKEGEEDGKKEGEEDTMLPGRKARDKGSRRIGFAVTLCKYVRRIHHRLFTGAD